MVACRDCGSTFSGLDLGACPECGSKRYLRQRCEGCGIVKLEAAMASSAGRLLSRAADLDFALQAGFTITLADVSNEEYQALQVLRSERDKHQERKPQEPQWPKGLTR